MHLVHPTKFCITIVLVLQFISPEKSDINGYAIVFVFLFFWGGGRVNKMSSPIVCENGD